MEHTQAETSRLPSNLPVNSTIGIFPNHPVGRDILYVVVARGVDRSSRYDGRDGEGVDVRKVPHCVGLIALRVREEKKAYKADLGTQRGGFDV